jgi:PAS domain S-box-containing protein
MSVPLRVLLLEDRLNDARLVVHELRQAGFEPQWERVDGEAEYVERLSQPWDVILADYSLPQFDAIAALKLVRERGIETPFIIVSGSIGEDTAVEAMKQGATDYLLKDRLVRLGPAVKQALEQRQMHAAQLRLSAERDQLLQRLKLHIERMPLAYILLDAQLRITDWNPAAERIFGFAREEAIGMSPPFERLVPPHAQAETASVIERVVSGELTAHAVHDNLTKAGRTITCEWFDTLLMAADGSFSGLLCLVQDISDRRRLEEQIRQAQKMEAIGRLAGGVAHDFNNLLTVISGYTDMALDSLRQDDPTREILEEVHKAGNRAAALTRQLLAFSRKQVLMPVVLDLNDLVRELEKMLVRLIGEDIDLAIRPAPRLWPVRVDAGQMEQVVMNLVVNARDAMPEGGKLTIETSNITLGDEYARKHAEARAGDHVLLAVTDTGAGMDEATQARIFEPFFTTKGPDRGTGLGLSTVYGIVKQSGGHIAVYSEPDRGTCFKIYLPSAQAPTATSGSAASSGPVLQGSETVLLVEDEAAVRALARTALKQRGYRVLEAADGADALRIAAEFAEPIHLLATDVVMPHMSGRELAERLVPLRPALRVLFLSGYMDDAIVRHGLLESTAAFLHKPYTPQALAAKVREVLDAGSEAAAR